MNSSEFEQDQRQIDADDSVLAIALEASKGNLLAQALSRALHNGPHMRYALPDETERQNVLQWVLTSAIRSAWLCGENYTTPTMDGGAVWVGPNSTSSIRRIVQEGLLPTGFKLTAGTLRRCMGLVASLEQVRRRVVRNPHWYLIALGVVPRQNRKAVRAALLRPGINRADSEGVPCYLETFEEQDIAFYHEFGFRIEGGGRISKYGPVFWAMLRSPK